MEKMKWQSKNDGEYDGFACAARKRCIEFIVITRTKYKMKSLWPKIMGREAPEIDMEKVMPASVKARRE
jgi:hypothetical protein